jgi:beta-lactamase class A
MFPALALSLVLAADPSAAGDLGARLTPYAKAHKGKVAIAVKLLGTGESFYLHADEPMPTASLIKLPVMVEVYQQAAEGKVKLDDTVTLRKDDKVQGSGILTDHFSDGATFSLRDAVRLMIAFSDNTATNLVLDKIGIGSTAKRMEDWGWPNTKINAKVFRGSTTSVFPERTKKFGLGSTTAREMVELLERLETGKLVSPVACKEMIAHLKKCEDKDKFSRFLPPGTVLAHKTGSVNEIRTDAGILYLKGGPVALCVLTSDNEDKSWRPDNTGNLLCAKVAKEVHDYFDKPK